MATYTSTEDRSIEVMEILLKHGADKDLRTDDSNKETALLKAVMNDRAKVSQFLIGKGCNVLLKGRDGNSPLHWAVKNKNEKLVRILIENNADVNAKDIVGDTPLDGTMIQGYSKRIIKLLKDAGAVHSRGPAQSRASWGPCRPPWSA